MEQAQIELPYSKLAGRTVKETIRAPKQSSETGKTKPSTEDTYSIRQGSIKNTGPSGEGLVTGI